ncbi:MAG: phosphoribosylaminoimidazolesuccinocarboxamide synthase [Bacteroidota bacterium]|nr:phosphoribosylaminoimidazolesuccinocarboxamide synthase [Bacteroidota bacterium]
MSNELVSTHYFFSKQSAFNRGKVRDIYFINDDLVALIATDRISAFDQVLPKSIPFKGQVLNQIASTFFDNTQHIVQNWKIAQPDPNVTIGLRCQPIPIEFVVRGYLSGHAWRLYQSGKRTICGNKLPDGLLENDRLPKPILTPSTKAENGHDQDISFADIEEQKILTKKQIEKLERISRELYAYGSQYAQSKDLILVDTKYEFGIRDNKIFLIDEIHTPDSSRYFYAKDYLKIQKKDQQQKQLSKEFVRKWLIENNFQGREGENIPELSEKFINSVTERYVELFEKLTGKTFKKRSYENIEKDIEKSINQFVESYYQQSGH